MQYAEGFILRESSVSCPECKSLFATRILADLPPVLESDIVEADLHRVLPHPALRGALIAVCPFCGCADWSAKFYISPINPALLEPAQDIQFSRKFAMAVKHARSKGIDPLDIAYIALNGLYCARESGEAADSWLELCVYEQSRGLQQDFLAVETGTDHLVMAELWRQIRVFDKAVEEYQKATMDGSVPEELIRHQVTITRAGDYSPTVLPPWMVRMVFPEAAELAVSVGAQPVKPQIIIHRPDPLAYLQVSNDQVVGVNKPAWANNVSREVDFELAFEDDTSRKQQRRRASDLLPQQVEPTPEEVEAEAAYLAQQIAAAQAAQAPQNAAPASPPAQPAAPAPRSPSDDEIAVTRVKQIIATPLGASTISLVHATNGGAISIAISPSTFKARRTAEGGWELPPMDAPTNEYFWGSKNPDKEDNDPSSIAVKRALKATNRKKVTTADDAFPQVQICDEDSGHAYTNYHQAGPQPEKEEEQPVEEQPQEQQPAAAQAQSGAMPVQDAAAKVESFLSLTRQPSYQNWIRGYRK